VYIPCIKEIPRIIIIIIIIEVLPVVLEILILVLEVLLLLLQLIELSPQPRMFLLITIKFFYASLHLYILFVVKNACFRIPYCLY